jgi:hypothetical protein
MRFGILFFIVSTFFACEKEEQPIEIPEAPGELQRHSVSMFPDYRDQVWFNLEKGTEVHRNTKTNWDILWDTNGKLRVNSSKALYAGLSDETELSNVTDTVGIQLLYDATTGNPDSTAFGAWGKYSLVNTQKVYVIDMGYDALGNHLGIKKCKFSLNGSALEILWGDILANSDFSSITILRNEQDDQYISIENGEIQTMLANQDWDIVFTQYIHVFYDEDPALPYLVTGVLSNPERVEVAELDSMITWENISLSDAEGVNYSKNVNVIGYDWKDYSFDTRGFTVFPWKMYLIKVDNEKVYKLRFLDFYNNLGEKGNPLFEYQKL